MSDSPTVFAIDDDPSVLRGLERLLRSAGFKSEIFATAQAFLEGYRQDVMGCLILDLSMPGFDGLQLQRQLIALEVVLPIIFLTGYGDIPTSVQAMKLGATDFLTKPVDDERLLAAVRDALQRCASLHVARRETTDFTQRLATLTPRERQVFNYLLSGALNKQIAGSLGTVEKTIKFHRAHIMKKMGTPTLAALIRQAERTGHGNP